MKKLKQPGQHIGHRLVNRQRMDDRILGEDVEVLYGVIQDDAGHRDTSQGISHIDPGVGEIAGFIHYSY